MEARPSASGLEEPPPQPGLSDPTAERVRLVLVALWFLFAATTPAWVEIYKGTGSGESLLFIYFFVALAFAACVRDRAETTTEAIVAVLPNIIFVAAAGTAGALSNAANDGRFGQPLYVYFGVALLASWTALLLATAIASRTRWNRMGGLVLGLAVAVVGCGLMTFQVN
jgi:hypothetical protein